MLSLNSDEAFKFELKLPEDPTAAEFKSEASLEIGLVINGEWNGQKDLALAVRLVNVRGLESPVIKALVEQKKLIYQYTK